MRRAYMFLIDFLEAVGKETSSRMRQNQASLRIILEVSVIFELAVCLFLLIFVIWQAAKISEVKIDEAISLNRDKVQFVCYEMAVCYLLLVEFYLMFETYTLKVTTPEFLVYLDSEIEGQEVNSQLQVTN